MKRKLALLLTFPLVISMTACSSDKTNNNANEGTGAASSTNNATDTDAVNGTTVPLSDIEPLTDEEYAAKAVYSDNYFYSQAEMTYLYRQVYGSYAYYLSYYGVDISKSLKEQEYEEGVSWFDVFMDEAENYAVQYLYFCEAAKENGMELTDENKDLIEQELKTLESNAAAAGYDNANDYLAYYYGPAVKEDTLQAYWEKYYLGYQMYDQIYNSYDFSEDEIEEFYQDNILDYQYVDYACYSFKVNEDSNISADLCEDYLNQASKAKNTDALEKVVRDFLEETAQESDSTDTTEDDLESTIKSTLEAMYFTQVSYSEEDEAKKWAFEEDTKVNDTYTVTDEENGTYTVYMLTKAAYRDESVLKNVRHILFTPTTYGSDEEAKAKAEEILQEWKDGEATEDSFAALADEYSEDGAVGGLYENVYEGLREAAFEEWLFDEARKPEDTGIVQTTYGYHVMYFVGDGEEQWYSDVRNTLLDNAMQAEYTALTEKYTVEQDDDVLQTVQEVL